MRKLWRIGAFATAAALLAAACSGGQDDSAAETFDRLLGEGNPKIKVEEGKTYVFAGGDPRDTGAPDTEWFDFTGAPMDPAALQYGIGKDRIRSIDDPLFVAPDDPRLLEIPPSRYRKDEVATTNDEIMVVGYVEGGEARAYPIALLDRHEVVNDEFRGKPLSVGW